MVFYFSSTTGEKMAKENSLTPFTGMWMATFILLPMGLFLTYKAMRDSRLFNMDSYNRAARFVGRLFGKKTKE
jgi:lipopolysaccharide export system permease protein